MDSCLEFLNLYIISLPDYFWLDNSLTRPTFFDSQEIRLKRKGIVIDQEAKKKEQATLLGTVPNK
jgi:hypothetical protein